MNDDTAGPLDRTHHFALADEGGDARPEITGGGTVVQRLHPCHHAAKIGQGVRALLTFGEMPLDLLALRGRQTAVEVVRQPFSEMGHGFSLPLWPWPSM